MSRKRKNIFANRVIIFCLAVTTIITAAVVWEYRRLDTVIPSGVLGVLIGFWGGELLIIALRQIFGSDVIRQDTKPEAKPATTDREDSI